MYLTLHIFRDYIVGFSSLSRIVCEQYRTPLTRGISSIPEIFFRERANPSAITLRPSIIWDPLVSQSYRRHHSIAAVNELADNQFSGGNY